MCRHTPGTTPNSETKSNTNSDENKISTSESVLELGINHLMCVSLFLWVGEWAPSIVIKKTLGHFEVHNGHSGGD
jgi:hypothetical protein